MAEMHSISPIPLSVSWSRSVLCPPTNQVIDVQQWQLFLVNAASGSVDMVGIERDADGYFNTKGTVFYTSPDPKFQSAVFERLPGLELRTASLPLDGLAMALADPPKLVLLDIQLPGMDGFELLQQLRADPRTRGVPAIAVSADALPASVERGRQAGFADYLPKPVDLDRLVSVVQSLISPG